MNKILLHVEGLTIFALSLYFYWLNDLNGLFFLLLILVPDLSMLGYTINKRVGAIIYNIFHTYTLSLLAVLLGWYLSNPIILAVGLIWTAHIGMDRMVGYGLKYPTDFKHNHLNQMHISKEKKFL
jgi:hypothetical protein